MEHEPLSEREEYVGKQVVDCAYVVHRALGPGLLEHVYEVCLCHELAKRGMQCRRQVPVRVRYDGITFEEALRLDVLVEDLVIVEVKAAEDMNPVYVAQVLTYLRLTDRRLGYVINFNAPLIRRGIRRLVR